jgi:hypothetical protein
MAISATESYLNDSFRASDCHLIFTSTSVVDLCEHERRWNFAGQYWDRSTAAMRVSLKTETVATKFAPEQQHRGKDDNQ